jgi:hypothetical protein
VTYPVDKVSLDGAVVDGGMSQQNFFQFLEAKSQNLLYFCASKKICKKRKFLLGNFFAASVYNIRVTMLSVVLPSVMAPNLNRFIFNKKSDVSPQG